MGIGLYEMLLVAATMFLLIYGTWFAQSSYKLFCKSTLGIVLLAFVLMSFVAIADSISRQCRRLFLS